jgi:hypothetical protein
MTQTNWPPKKPGRFTWATRHRIEWLHGQVLEETGVEVDSFLVGRDIEGMTARNFDPHKHVSISAEALSDSGD